MRRLPLLTLVALLAPLTALSQPKLTADAIKGLEFRNIGPAIMGGRIDDFAVVESRPSTFYVATASAGIWKTTNQRNDVRARLRRPGGFDHRRHHPGPVRPADPLRGDRRAQQPPVLVVGERRVQDARRGQDLGAPGAQGHACTSAGSPSTRRTPRSSTWRPWATCGAPTRSGVSSRRRDGGKTWRNTKFIDADTGFVDVAMDPESPDTLYAASYQRRRTPFGYNGGGPGSGLWKTVDGGARWTKLTKGLPEGDMGRMGIAVYRRDPRMVYLLVEHAKEGGVLPVRGPRRDLEEDLGHQPAPVATTARSTSTRTTTSASGCWAPPCSTPRTAARPSARTVVQKIHGDYHAFWIDPADSNHMLVGSDGGIHLSFDRGRSWNYLNTVALAQFYEVHYDMQKPYRVCGGLQDNGTWLGPSRTLYQQGITNEDWYRVGGGDGFYCVIDPSDPNVDLRGEPGRQRRALRPGHQRAAGDPPGAAGRRAIPLQLELPHPDLAARPQDDLLRRQPPLRLEGPRRDLDAGRRPT